MTRPVWLQNAEWVLDHGPAPSVIERLAVLLFFCQLALRWLDDNMIRGSEENQAVCSAWMGRLRSFAEWDKIIPPTGALEPAYRCYVRMNGALAAAEVENS